jgi:hypothetical protein
MNRQNYLALLFLEYLHLNLVQSSTVPRNVHIMDWFAPKRNTFYYGMMNTVF